MALLATSQVMFAAIATPHGIRSGAWSVAGFSDPDTLVYVASGATLVFPLLFYPLWVGFGGSGFQRRFRVTFCLCLAFMTAVALRGYWRSNEPQIAPLTLAVACFSLVTLCCYWIRRYSGYCIANSSIVAFVSATGRHRLQIRLRHMFVLLTVAACSLAWYRFRFPDGVPADLLADWQRQITRTAVYLPFAFLVLLPTALIPWMVLGFRGSRRTSAMLAAGTACFWVAFDGGLTLLQEVFHLGTSQSVVWPQLGAGVAGLVSALVVRSCGYRVFVVPIARGCPTRSGRWISLTS